MAYDYQAKTRATRDLLRRRTYMTRRRADLLSHIQNTNSQYHQPAFPFHIEHKCRREETLTHFTDPDVLMGINTDFNLIDQFSIQIRAMEAYILENTHLHDSESMYLLRTIHGIGKILSMTILYEIGDINRFPRVQEFASYSRLVKCSRESAGKRYGTAGSKIGNAHLKWAFSQAAVMFLKGNPKGKEYRARIQRKHGKAKSLSILAHKLGRTAYYMLKRQATLQETKRSRGDSMRKKPFDMNKFLSA